MMDGDRCFNVSPRKACHDRAFDENVALDAGALMPLRPDDIAMGPTRSQTHQDFGSRDPAEGELIPQMIRLRLQTSRWMEHA